MIFKYVNDQPSFAMVRRAARVGQNARLLLGEDMRDKMMNRFTSFDIGTRPSAWKQRLLNWKFNVDGSLLDTVSETRDEHYTLVPRHRQTEFASCFIQYCSLS